MSSILPFFWGAMVDFMLKPVGIWFQRGIHTTILVDNVGYLGECMLSK